MLSKAIEFTDSPANAHSFWMPPGDVRDGQNRLKRFFCRQVYGNGDSKDQVGSVQKWGKCSQTEGLGPLHGPKTTWIYMDLPGPTWTYIDLHRPTWTYIDLHGPTWTYIDLHGPTWGTCNIVPVCSATSLDFCWASSILGPSRWSNDQRIWVCLKPRTPRGRRYHHKLHQFALNPPQIPWNCHLALWHKTG